MRKYLLISVLFLLSSSVNASVTWQQTKEVFQKLGGGDMPLLLVKDSDPNASYNENLGGKQWIQVNTGMLSFAKDENEIAMILGHEIGHWKLQTENETRADEYGAQLIESKGFDRCDGIQVIWRFHDNGDKEHPPSAVRYKHLAGGC